ncbi:SDR family NAD(P)-dependent oxidoreductase [Granulicella sp. 5B5]|nr:SDR family NAD(P)-dependent oxidoreductase [Granulicella sp. 5B5]
MKDKVVFVTGGGAGIGAATALEFAKLGAKVMVCARREATLQEIVPKLREAGASDVHAFVLDVRDPEAVANAFAGLPESWQAVDVLVNNAGLSRGLTKMYEDDIQNWEEMIDTNVKGLLYVTRAVVPGMVKRNNGHVINLGSTAGHMTYPGGGVYCASKAAEKAITEGLRIDVNGTAVRVASIDPGMVETDFSLVRFRGDAEKAAKVYANASPLTPEDVAETIAWVATREPNVMIQTVVMTAVSQANAFVLARKS